MLVVMMLILVATSAGVWAMQSSLAEQKASTSLLEISLAHAEAECSAMAGVVLEEGTQGALNVPPELLTKYYLPNPVGTIYTKDFADADGGFGCGRQTAMRALPWSLRSRRIHDSSTYGTPPSSGGGGGGDPASFSLDRSGGQLVVITGYGELSLASDPLDQNKQRGVHEVVAMSRAYFDVKN
jgi:hypothetical protein